MILNISYIVGDSKTLLHIFELEFNCIHPQVIFYLMVQ